MPGKSVLPPPPGGRRAPPPPPAESEEAPPPLPSRPTPAKPGGSSTPSRNGPLRPSPDDSYVEPNQWTSDHGMDTGPPLPPRPPNLNSPSASSDSSFQDEEYEEPGTQVSAPPPLPPHPNVPKSIKQPSHQAVQEPQQEEEYSELDGVGMVEQGLPSPTPDEPEQEEYDEFELGGHDEEGVEEETYEAPESQQDTYEEVPSQGQPAAPKHLPPSSKVGVPLPAPPASSNKNSGAPINKPQETYESVPAPSQPSIPARLPPSSGKTGVPLPPPPSSEIIDQISVDTYETLPDQRNRTPTPPPPPPAVPSQRRPVPPPSAAASEESIPEVPDRSKQEIPKNRAASGMPPIGQDQLNSARMGLKQTNSKLTVAPSKQEENVQSQGDFRSTLEKFKHKEQGKVPVNASKFSDISSKKGNDKSNEETVSVGPSVKERLTMLISDKAKKSGIAAASCPVPPPKPIPPPKENKYVLQAKAYPTILKPKPVMIVSSFSPPLPPATSRIPSTKKQTETQALSRPKSPAVENDEDYDQEEIYDDALSKPQDPLIGHKWFKDVERQQANSMVKAKHVDGAYMVRTSSGKETDQPYSLVVLYKNHVYNLKIRHKKDGRYALGEEKSDELTFKDVPDLIQHHTKQAVMLVNNKENKQYETILTVCP